MIDKKKKKKKNVNYLVKTCTISKTNITENITHTLRIIIESLSWFLQTVILLVYKKKKKDQ